MRPILSVIAPHSGSGKTSFVTHLVRQIPGLGCLKISPAHDWPDEESVAGRTTGPGFFLEGAADLNRPGKDTALYLTAGAAQVERLRHRGNGLAAGLNVALERFPRARPIVVESSSAAPLLSPVAIVLVVRPPLHEMKPATEAILALVTDLMINTSNPGRRPAERLQREYPSLRPKYACSADLSVEALPVQMMTRWQALLAGA